MSHIILLILYFMLAGACAHGGADYPVYEEGRPLGFLSGLAGAAPPVTSNVTFERLIKARSEPQNWLTYYGAYGWLAVQSPRSGQQKERQRAPTRLGISVRADWSPGDCGHLC